MLDAYQELEFSGNSLEFESVLTNLEDYTLKSLLVTLYEQAKKKLPYTRDTAEHRLSVLTRRMGEQQDALRQQQQVSELQKNQYSEEEEMKLLQDVIRQAKLRQGLPGSVSESVAMPTSDSPSLPAAENSSSIDGDSEAQQSIDVLNQEEGNRN